MTDPKPIREPGRIARLEVTKTRTMVRNMPGAQETELANFEKEYGQLQDQEQRDGRGAGGEPLLRLDRRHAEGGTVEDRHRVGEQAHQPHGVGERRGAGFLLRRALRVARQLGSGRDSRNARDARPA